MSRYSGCLKGYSYKEFVKVLNEKGFFFHHKNAAHHIFVNDQWQYVTVPASNKKEMNHLMTTVILQRIKNNNSKFLPKDQRNF